MSICVFKKKIFFSKDLFVSRILPVILIQPGSVRMSVLIQDLEKRRASGLFTFIIRRDWEGSDVCFFWLVNSILKTH